MDTNDKPTGPHTSESDELFLPFGGTDPDFYLPAEGDYRGGKISRWLRSIPVFGR